MRIRYFPAKFSNTVELDAINRASMPENYETRFWTLILSQHLSLVAKCNNIIIGYILIGTINDETTVISLAVDAAFRGNGIGKELLHHGIKKLKKNRNNGKLHLMVRKSNLIALKLYQNNGFIIKKTIPDYYSNPQDDGISMELSY